MNDQITKIVLSNPSTDSGSEWVGRGQMTYVSLANLQDATMTNGVIGPLDLMALFILTERRPNG